MLRKRNIGIAALVALAFLVFCVRPLAAQTTTAKRALITRGVDDNSRVTLHGNTRPELRFARDRGRVTDNLPLEHMYLQMKRSPEQQLAAQQLVDRLHDQRSPDFHRWLTADQIAERFGPAEQDIRTVTRWLESHGFRVNEIYRANGVIDFSGTANAIRSAFRTEIHHIDVQGKAHIANISDPQIPSALAPAVHGVVSMNDFHPRPLNRPRSEYTYFWGGYPYFGVVPGDLATIYNFNPLFAKGITGKGQTIVVVENSNVYSTDDWYTFRSVLGLTQNFPYGSFQQIHPQPSNNPNNGGPCADPGVSYADSEAIIDAEWASAAAPNAAIVLASCADTNTNFGGYIAMQNLLTGRGKPPGIISVSYGASESYVGESGNAYINQLYEMAVMRGVSVFVASGDQGADTSDGNEPAAVAGINVSGFASTPHNVAVGGTDFGDVYLGNYWDYWSTTNGQYFNSALSYVPEIPWNNSCAGSLVSSYLGYPAPYGADGFCNSALGLNFMTTVAASGGPSACATGTPDVWGIVGGTCKGYKKPLYQKLVSGVPRDGVRDLPDVSMFAANGLWSNYFVICFSDPNGGYPCEGDPMYWAGAGGTSFGAPIMAGVQAMINQAAHGYQGNPNYVYYLLGAAEYDFGKAAACDSTLGNQVGSRCVFRDVTLGDITINCLPLTDSNGNTIGTFNCYIPSGTNGVLSVSNTSYQPAYPATSRWDFATGLGTPNVYNLVKSWPGVRIK